DEGQPRLAADAREGRVLGEEAVAGVDGVGPRDLRRGDDRGDVEVALLRRPRADADGFVREARVDGFAVDVAVDGDGLDAELTARLDDPQRDLATVGDEDLFEH